MTLGLIFLLGIANFAMHKAVLESRHPLLDLAPGLTRGRGRSLLLLGEFLVLVAAMLMAARVWPGFTVIYACYTALNGVTAWVMLGRGD